jgi:hypothetical protein
MFIEMFLYLFLARQPKQFQQLESKCMHFQRYASTVQLCLSSMVEMPSNGDLISLYLSGKWMFEVLLGTRGIMQLGWATVNCQFNNEVLNDFFHSMHAVDY